MAKSGAAWANWLTMSLLAAIVVLAITVVGLLELARGTRDVVFPAFTSY